MSNMLRLGILSGLASCLPGLVAVEIIPPKTLSQPAPTAVAPVTPAKPVSPGLLAAVAKERGIGCAPDAKAAFAEFKRLAEAGDAHACCHLGVCYVEGVGVEKNSKLAMEWLEKSAAAGDMPGKAYLGFQLMQGESPDLKRAEALLMEASKAGVVLADLWLGMGYSESKNGSVKLSADTHRARRHLKAAAEKGESLAQMMLGCELQDVAPKDCDGAFNWNLRAARNGMGLSCVKLSQLYLKGRGVGVDAKESYVWLLAARKAPVTPLSPENYRQLQVALASRYSAVDEKWAEAEADRRVKAMPARAELSPSVCDCASRAK